MSYQVQERIKRRTLSIDNIELTASSTDKIDFTLESGDNFIGISHVRIDNATTNGVSSSMINNYGILIVSSSIIRLYLKNTSANDACVKIDLTYLYTD